MYAICTGKLFGNFRIRFLTNVKIFLKNHDIVIEVNLTKLIETLHTCALINSVGAFAIG